ncbi:hypothetical protein L484_005107 [Morus notabilis]|uniref:LOB domain-containing protein n=2 Tax=Morus notabilis TaxID=981085 RepID=W9S4B2_9ROSA|nr:hypothetical protein L484_005107 [Morus notabilis]
MSLSTIATTSSTPTTTTTTKGNGSAQACAACKYQRRKCAPDCVLAPYFPHDNQRQFLNAHKLFGVSNITKIIKNLDPRTKDEAMRTIIFQSDARASDPVGGCYRIICDLQQQIEYAKAELNFVLHHLALCRTQHAGAAAVAATTAAPDIANGVDHLNLYGNNSMTNEGQFLQPVQEHEQYFVLNDDVSSWVVQDSVAPSVSADIKQDMDVKPFIEDHQRGEAVLRAIGDAMILKEEQEYSMQLDDDSKDATNLFRLTNCSS